MSTQLKIYFDKSDRKYCCGEQVAGKVVVDAQTEITCGGLRISYGWRTHGKGNTDKGSGGLIELVKKDMKFLKGDHQEFPFRFYAPTGPITYHGHYVNVDWYLEAKLDIHFLKVFFNVPNFFSSEEDFLLTGSEPPINDRFGEMPYSSPNYSPPSESSSFFSSLMLAVQIGGAFLISYLVYNFFLHGYPAVAILLIVFSVAFIARRKIFNFAFRQKIDIKEVQVVPSDIHPGDRASSRIQFQTKGSVYLDHIATKIIAVENAVSGGGTQTQSYSFITYREQYINPYGEELAAGRWINYECPLPIPANAPPTFKASNNSIYWSIHMKIACKRWPSWEKTMPITISPRIIRRLGKDQGTVAIAVDRAG